MRLCSLLLSNSLSPGQIVRHLIFNVSSIVPFVRVLPASAKQIQHNFIYQSDLAAILHYVSVGPKAEQRTTTKNIVMEPCARLQGLIVCHLHISFIMRRSDYSSQNLFFFVSCFNLCLRIQQTIKQ